MRLEIEVLELRTRHEFHIARAAAPPVRRNVWVRLEDSTGLEGWGEAAPNAYYGESAETVLAALRSYEETLAPLRAASVDIAVTEHRLSADTGNASARAAVSAALHDLVGKLLDQPVWKILGLQPRQQVSSYTIGIDDLEVMRRKTREAAAYRILKVKVGTDRDAEILTMLREERPDAIIRVDANTGWTARQAIELLPLMERFGIELIEQPVPPDDIDGLAEVTRASRIPIIADESCRTAADVEKLRGKVHGVNIKLAKCGSIGEALRIAQAARAADMKVMIGCMIESTLGIAAAAHIASLADYIDLDGAALLANDPFDGPKLEADGSLVLPNRPGLGVIGP